MSLHTNVALIINIPSANSSDNFLIFSFYLYFLAKTKCIRLGVNQEVYNGKMIIAKSVPMVMSFLYIDQTIAKAENSVFRDYLTPPQVKGHEI